MSDDNPRVWRETIRHSHGITVRVKVVYKTERGTTVTATRTDRSSNESDLEMHKRLKRIAMTDIKDTVDEEVLGDE